MSQSSSKEKILKKIRKALSDSTPLPFPQSEGSANIYHPPAEELEFQFAEEFSRLEGKFSYCIDEGEMLAGVLALCKSRSWNKIFCSEKPLQQLLSLAEIKIDPTLTLRDCEVSITSCESLVSRTGTIVMSAAQSNGRTASVYAPMHICIAYSDQVVYDVRDAIKLLKDKYTRNLPSLITFASGPSRTADIEKTLIVGVHGPAEVYVFLVDRVANQR
ncbi:MAG: LUD domain-containing protein [Chitinophagaceae bacterium]